MISTVTLNEIYFNFLCQLCNIHPPYASSWKKFPKLLTYSNHIPSRLSNDHITDYIKFWYFYTEIIKNFNSGN